MMVNREHVASDGINFMQINGLATMLNSRRREWRESEL